MSNPGPSGCHLRRHAGQGRRPGRADSSAGRDAALSRADADGSRVGGTGRRREVPLHQRLQRYLRHHRARPVSRRSRLFRGNHLQQRHRRGHRGRSGKLAAGGIFHPQEPHGPAEHRPAARLRRRGLPCGDGDAFDVPTDDCGLLEGIRWLAGFCRPAWSLPEPTAVHYWRFRVPITIAAGMAGARCRHRWALLRPDARPGRQGRRCLCCSCAASPSSRSPCVSTSAIPAADAAHRHRLLAAHAGGAPHRSSARQRPDRQSAQWTRHRRSASWRSLSVLALVALVVDRRAILVSGLSYAGFAFGSLVVKAGLSDGVVPLTMLVLGALVLLLSAGWHVLRRTLLSLLPVALYAGFRPIHKRPPQLV